MKMSEIRNHFKKWIYWFLLGVAIIIVYKALDNFGDVVDVIGKFFGIISPFFVGIFIAYLLYIPCKKMEEAYKKSKRKFIKKNARGMSIISVYFIVAILIIILVSVILPVVIESIKDLVNNMQGYFEIAINNYNNLPSDSILKGDWAQDVITNIKNININQLIEDLLPKFSLRVEDKGGKFSAYLEADQDEVLADEVHVTNVISNLVDNAIKYCVKPPEITIYTRNKDKEIIISVIDNGIGIAKKDQKLIFERFYRVSTGNLHDVKGFGLGLSYVKKIVEAHGGRIDVESSLEKGSCFDIILPLTVKKQKIKRTLFF